MSPEQRDRALRIGIASSAAKLEAADENPKNQAILKVLEKPIRMSFSQETPLEDVITWIKQETTTANQTIPIYVDPIGLNEENKTLQSTVCYLDLDGVPLKTSLRLMLRQLGLAYCVRDGVLIISSVQGISQELREEMSVQEALEEMSAQKAPHPSPGLQ
jgi:hypothetical protein